MIDRIGAAGSTYTDLFRVASLIRELARVTNGKAASVNATIVGPL